MSTAPLPRRWISIVDVAGRVFHRIVQQLPHRELQQRAIGIDHQVGGTAFDDVWPSSRARIPAALR